MAFENGFFNAVYDEERLGYFPRYDAAEFARRFSLYFTDGVFYNASTALQVSAKSGLKLVVNAGACNIRGYYGINTSVEEITLAAADAFLPRIDAICARLDIPNKTVGLYVIKGTESTDPAIPTAETLTRNADIYDLMLAYAYIPAGATQITNANITDTRGDERVCGFVTSTVNQLSTSSFWAQWQAAFSEYAAKQEADFMTWWNGFKDTLATIDASALVLRQDELEAKVNRILELLEPSPVATE